MVGVVVVGVGVVEGVVVVEIPVWRESKISVNPHDNYRLQLQQN